MPEECQSPKPNSVRHASFGRVHSGSELERLKKAAEADPKNGSRWHDLAVAYCRFGHGEASLDVFKTKLQFGGSAWQWLYMAMATGNWTTKMRLNPGADQSMDWVERAQRKGFSPCNPKSRTCWATVPWRSHLSGLEIQPGGTNFEKQGQKEKAKEAYSKAIDYYEQLLLDFLPYRVPHETR